MKIDQENIYYQRFRHLSVLLVMLTFMATNQLVGQISAPEKSAHSFKVYRDLDSRKLFWPKSSPVYVWLSTSSETSSKKHLLEEGRSSVGESKENLPEARIDLELSGNQFVRWVNYQTQDTILLQFQADGISPTSKVTFSEATESKKEGIQFYGSGLKASFSAQDQHSGVENIFVSVNGSEYTPYHSAFTFNQEREYLIAWYSIDNVGNSEAIQTLSFQVDRTPPTTKHVISGIHQGDILAPSSQLQLVGKDALSGLSQTHYHFDNDELRTASVGEIPVSSLGEGAHILYYYSTDRVKNTEPTNQYNFYVDETPPVTEIVIQGDLHSANASFVSERTLFRFSASDNKTGVKSTVYSIQNQKEVPFTGDTFSLPTTSKEYSISFFSTDNVDNKETAKIQKFILDNSAPKSSHSFEGISFTQRGTTWIPSSTSVLLKATDSQSGVNHILYSVSGDIQNATYKEPLQFSNEGKYSLEYSATDNVNNTEDGHVLNLIVDDTPPKIIVNFSLSKIGSKTSSEGTILDEYPTGTQLYLAATDESSGAEGLWVTLNADDEKPFSTPLTFSEKGEYEVTIRTSDKVGNTQTMNQKFIISE